MQIKEFKIRASAISQIMTNPRKKTDNLSQTAKTHCETWLKEQIYGVRKEIGTKPMQKGIEMETKAIEIVESFYNYDFLIKNEQFFENKFITGTPDLVLPNCIRDIKCPWDCFTFPLFEKKLIPTYYWQMQGYMELCEKSHAFVDYVLVETPEDLDPNAVSYDSVEPKYLVKSFKVEREESAILAINERVKLCRDYIKTLI